MQSPNRLKLARRCQTAIDHLKRGHFSIRILPDFRLVVREKSARPKFANIAAERGRIVVCIQKQRIEQAERSECVIQSASSSRRNSD